MSGDSMTKLIEGWIRGYGEAKEEAADVALFDKYANESGGTPLRDIMTELARGDAAHV